MDKQNLKTLRLMIPQWQGGYDESIFPEQIYPLGARLLAWLAPKSDAPLIEIPIKPANKNGLSKDGGVFYQKDILNQIKSTREVIEEYKPERIISFGGDCLISQAPFSYLNEYYNGEIALIWIDAHPDISTPNDFDHAHAMVLGNLLGEGGPEMAKEVGLHFKPEQILFVGVDNVLLYEKKSIKRLNLQKVASKDILSSQITDWIKSSGYKKVAIHLDLDVLDPTKFHSLLFNNPDVKEHINSEHGKIDIKDISKVLQNISNEASVVGISFAEYMPWDANNLKNMLNELSFMR